MVKARGVEYSKELWLNTGTLGLLEAFGFIQLVLSKHMKVLILQCIYLGFDSDL